MTTENNAPSWDLGDFYENINDKKIDEDLIELQHLTKNFIAEYKDKISSLDESHLSMAIDIYAQIEELAMKLLSYAQLIYAAQMSDEKNATFYQKITENITEITNELVFFSIEINNLNDDKINKIYTSPLIGKNKKWIEDIRLFKPHQLSFELEKFISEKSITSSNAWIRLFDETLAKLEFKYDNDHLSVAEILDKLSNPDPAVREKAAKIISQVFANNISIFTMITNILAKDKDIEDRWRKFARPISARNLDNQIEDEVVDTLVASVKEYYPKLSHRYYKLKAKWMKQDKLNFWDRNAPLPNAADTKYSWHDAKEIVLDSYGKFDHKFAEIGGYFFERNWIDAQMRKGKESGAFSHPTVPSVHPYILMNYQGKQRDVMTLAHELGHGIHQVMAAKQGVLLADTPLTLAETASVFGEQIVFRALLEKEHDEMNKKALIAAKVEDMLNTVVRQIAFLEFERQVHDARKNGELSSEDLGKIWLNVQSESLGDGIIMNEGYENYWAYIPHFIHSPFYVYSYAFGDCLVNALYAIYQENPDGFAEKYITLLEAGGSQKYDELLKPFDIDLKDKNFWKKGLDIISEFIDQLED